MVLNALIATVIVTVINLGEFPDVTPVWPSHWFIQLQHIWLWFHFLQNKLTKQPSRESRPDLLYDVTSTPYHGKIAS